MTRQVAIEIKDLQGDLIRFPAVGVVKPELRHTPDLLPTFPYLQYTNATYHAARTFPET